MDSDPTSGARGAPDLGHPQTQSAGAAALTRCETAPRPANTASPTTNDGRRQKKHIRPKAGKTKFWQKRIKKELTVPANNTEVREGPWDPAIYIYRKEDKIRFFSGRPMRPGCLEDRENFSRWAIEEALREYQPERYRISGNIMDSESVASMAKANVSPDKILQAIRIEGQRDIDTEVC